MDEQQLAALTQEVWSDYKASMDEVIDVLTPKRRFDGEPIEIDEDALAAAKERRDEMRVQWFAVLDLIKAHGTTVQAMHEVRVKSSVLGLAR